VLINVIGKRKFSWNRDRYPLGHQPTPKTFMNLSIHYKFFNHIFCVSIMNNPINNFKSKNKWPPPPHLILNFFKIIKPCACAFNALINDCKGRDWFGSGWHQKNSLGFAFFVQYYIELSTVTIYFDVLVPGICTMILC